LQGKLPDGTQIKNAADGRRAATDLTLSPNKTVSLQALVFGDDRLIDAHDKAVEKTLAYAESLAAYRISNNGETQMVQSGNITAATFRHETSRDLDPALHTHCVLLNVTQTQEGGWKALNVTQIYKQQKLMTAYYRSELANEVQKLGYGIERTHNDGRFELAGFSREQVEAFSQRTSAIEKYLEERGKTSKTASASEKELATLATRQNKQKVDRSELSSEWKARAKELGIENAVPSYEQGKNIDRVKGADESVKYAVEHLTERNSIVTKNEIVQTALESGVGKTGIKEIEKSIERSVDRGDLIQSKDRFTTNEAQVRERQMLNMEERGRGAVTQISNESKVRDQLSVTALNVGQRGAATLINVSNNRFIAVQGCAGTGKTTMLKEATKIAESNDYKVLGAAPSAAAARELSNAGIESKTLASYQVNDFSLLDDKTVLIVDEASMVSARDMHHLMSTVEEKNSRVVLVGDVQQLQSVSAGKAFAQLQENGISKASVGEILRQKNSDLKNAVSFASKGEISKSIEKLNGIVEVDYAADRHQRIASDYSGLSNSERSATIIVAGTNSARTSINDRVRVGLGLKGEGVVMQTLNSKNLTEAQSRMSASYSVGDTIQTVRGSKSLDMDRGEMAQIVSVEPAKITLEKESGEQTTWNPAVQTNVMSYEVQEKEFSEGDRVRVDANDYSKGLVNGDLAEVKSIDEDRITLSLDTGKEVSLDVEKPQNLDHAYCQTIYASQGQTVERVMVEADTQSLTVNENSFYVAISRAENEAVIYTDDKDMLPESMGRSMSDEAALDIEKDTAREMEV